MADRGHFHSIDKGAKNLERVRRKSLVRVRRKHRGFTAAQVGCGHHPDSEETIQLLKERDERALLDHRSPIQIWLGEPMPERSALASAKVAPPTEDDAREAMRCGRLIAAAFLAGVHR